jgi:UDP-N-acetylmuramate dehydrogenase
MSETASVLTLNDRDELRALFAERVQFDAPLAPLTWWQIGGLADALVEAHDTVDVARLLEFCRRRQIGWFVLGNGSNILVGDGGLRGVVVRLHGAFRELTMTTTAQTVEVEAGGGASLAVLTGQAASRGALGIDGLAGIPATRRARSASLSRRSKSKRFRGPSRTK